MITSDTSGHGAVMKTAWRDLIAGSLGLNTTHDMLLLLCQYAASYRPDVLKKWLIHVTNTSAAEQRICYPSANPATVEILDRLERWDGDVDRILDIRANATFCGGMTMAFYIAESAIMCINAKSPMDAAYMAASAAAFCKPREMLQDLAKMLDEDV